MKKIYERPEIEALEVRAEDIITLSLMLPDISIINDSGDDSDLVEQNEDYV